MKIAVLAWGPLVRDRGNVRGAAKFAPNGPLLPIEFCRVSGDGRLTLVIDETFGAVCTTYSMPSALDDLYAATEDLRIREEMLYARGIGFVEPASGKSSDVAMRRHPQAVETIMAWAQANGYDAAIWKIVAGNFAEPAKGGEPFSVTAAIRYLEKLEARDAANFASALAYIRNAPPEVQTPVREEVDRRWPG